MDQDPAKNDKTASPSVAIDGTRIRSIRETKKLTQLYIANVVGVTTDTISRWENNRYPTIKRDNAEKLAGALEVELAEITRPETPPEATEQVVPSRTGKKDRLLLSGLAGLVLLLLAVFLLVRYLMPAPTAVRWAPHFAAPGEIIPIQVKITRKGSEQVGFILKEFLPPGWRLVSTLPPSSAKEPSGNGVKWLIPGGSASLAVSYSVQAPTSASLRQAVLQGEIVMRSAGMNRSEAVGGSNTIQIGPYHWADMNGDGRIDDDEIMPAYYICEGMKGVGLDWNTIEAIWSGKGYRWDQVHGYTVLK